MERSTQPQTNHNFSHIDLRAAADRLLGQGKRRGKVVMYRSPLRPDDDTPSFAVYADGFKDFGGSGESGGHLSFVQHVLGCDRAAAVEWLTDFAGGSISPLSMNGEGAEHVRTGVRPQTAEHEPPPARWQDAAFTAVETARNYLWGNRPDAKKALAYLTDVRGLTIDTILRFHLGYNPAWKSLSYRSPDTGKPVSLPPGITIPYLDNGTIWAVRVRSRVGSLAQALGMKRDDTNANGDPLPKYLNLTGSRAAGVLFNANALISGQDVLIVEGEFDVMLAAQHLKQVSVVTFGAASTAPAHIPARWRDPLRAAKSIWLALDNDRAGQQAADRLSAALPGAQQIALDGVKDATDFVQQGGDLRVWWENRTSAAPCHFANGVPDSWRRAFLTLWGESSAALYEHLTDAVKAKLLNPKEFTVAEVLNSLLKMGRSPLIKDVARPLSKLVSAGVFRKIGYSKDSGIVSHSAKLPSNTGAPAHFYAFAALKDQRDVLYTREQVVIHQRAYPLRMRDGSPAPLASMDEALIRSIVPDADPDEIRRLAQEAEAASAPLYESPGQRGARTRAANKEKRMLADLDQRLNDPQSSPLEAEWLAQGEYRLAFLRALRRYREAEFFGKGQGRIADAIGIVQQRIGEFLDAAGIPRLKPSDDESAISLTPAPETVTKEIRQQAHNHYAMPLAVRLVTPSGQVDQQPYTAENAVRLAEQAAATPDARLEVILQLPNQHGFIEDQPLPKKPAREKRVPEKKPSAISRFAKMPNEPPAEPSPLKTELLQDAPAIHEVQVENAPPRSAAQTADPSVALAYDRRWARGQLVLRFIRHADRYVHPTDGTFASVYASARELLELLVGRRVQMPDPLVDAIRASGGVVQRESPA